MYKSTHRAIAKAICATGADTMMDTAQVRALAENLADVCAEFTRNGVFDREVFIALATTAYQPPMPTTVEE